MDKMLGLPGVNIDKLAMTKPYLEYGGNGAIWELTFEDD